MLLCYNTYLFAWYCVCMNIWRWLYYRGKSPLYLELFLSLNPTYTTYYLCDFVHITLWALVFVSPGSRFKWHLPRLSLPSIYCNQLTQPLSIASTIFWNYHIYLCSWILDNLKSKTINRVTVGNTIISRVSKISSVKSQRVKTLGFGSHMVSVVTAWLWQ